MTSLSTARPLVSYRSDGLQGSVVVPGDKSISHRSLMLSAIAEGRSTIEGLLEGEDVLATARALQSLGVSIQKSGTAYLVDGVGIGGLQESPVPLDFGNAGTGSRISMGLVGVYPFQTTFIGDSSLSARPMERILTPLRSFGVEVISHDGGRLPITLRGPQSTKGIFYRSPVASAQVKSSVLMAALMADGETTFAENELTRDHTERMLKGFGAEIQVEHEKSGERLVHLRGKPKLHAQNLKIPADPSSAAFIIVGALIVPNSDITVMNVLLNPTRTGLLDTLMEMGGDLTISNRHLVGGEEVGDIRVRHSPLQGVVVPASRAPSMIDEYPILAVAAAFARGETTMLGLAELRVKESDRLSTMARGLKTNGVECLEGPDHLTVVGSASAVGGGTVVTNSDHRIAMSFLILGLASERPVTIDDENMIATSFPSFKASMTSLGARFVAQ